MTRISSFFALAALAFFGGALAQTPSISLSLGLSVYPSDGQSIEQLNSDEGQCYSWAMQSTGYDPKNPTPEQQPAQAQQNSGGAAAAGALRGAARGALIANATDNDWEELAALGMVSGARRGAASAQQRNAQAQQQAAAQQQQADQQQLQLFKNGYTACMEGRNYAVR